MKILKNYCKRCGIDLSFVNTYHGSFIEGNWFRKGRWVYWCDKCKREEMGIGGVPDCEIPQAAKDCNPYDLRSVKRYREKRFKK